MEIDLLRRAYDVLDLSFIPSQIVSRDKEVEEIFSFWKNAILKVDKEDEILRVEEMVDQYF